MLDAEEQGARAPRGLAQRKSNEELSRSELCSKQERQACHVLAHDNLRGASPLQSPFEQRSIPTRHFANVVGYARKAMRTNGNLWRVPITTQSGTDATNDDALQPLRRRGMNLPPMQTHTNPDAKCKRSNSRAGGGRTAPEEMGRSPIFDKRG